MLIIEVVLRCLLIAHVNDDGNVRQHLPHKVNGIHSCIKIALALLCSHHVGHHQYLRRSVIDYLGTLVHPLLELDCRLDLEENCWGVEFLDESVEGLETFVFLVIDPEDVVVADVGHLTGRNNLLKAIVAVRINCAIFAVRKTDFL